jgi:hypothetical protein
MADLHPSAQRLAAAEQTVESARAERNAAIRAAIERGDSLREIGRAFGVSHQYVARARDACGPELAE